MTDDPKHVFNVSMDVLIPNPVFEDREPIHEFADAISVERVASSADGGVLQVTYGVVAPNEHEAYRRGTNLVDAKLAAAGIVDYGLTDVHTFGPDEVEKSWREA